MTVHVKGTIVKKLKHIVNFLDRWVNAYTDPCELKARISLIKISRQQMISNSHPPPMPKPQMFSNA
jgi:hypothetical protein